MLKLHNIFYEDRISEMVHYYRYMDTYWFGGFVRGHGHGSVDLCRLSENSIVIDICILTDLEAL